MKSTLRVLNIEDSEQDVVLLRRHLSLAGYEVESDRVDTAAAMMVALETGEWDVILSDYSMPQFNALGALKTLKEIGRDIPFIIISGTIGEDVAVEAMRAGAHDYLMKSNLARLAPTIERELHEMENRRALRLAEEALRESEDRYRDLVEHSHDLICTHDLEGRLLSVNQAAARRLGYDRDVLLGRDIREALLPEFRDEFNDYLAKILKEGIARGLMTVRTIAGEKRIWEYTNTLRSEGVAVPVVRGVAHDVTERRRVEEKLHATNQKLETFVQASPLAIVALDMERKVTLWNPAAEGFFGWTESEVVGRLLPTIADDELQNQLILRERFLTSEGTPVISNLETRRVRKDGSTIEVSVSFAPLRDKQGAITGTIGILADITQRKKAEEELKNSHQRLEQTLVELQGKREEVAAMTQQLWQASKLATMGELAASIAHELNNPLTTVALRTESLLLQLAENDPNRAPLEVISQEVDRMAALVNNLLQFSRRSHRQVSTVDVREEIANSIEFVHYHLRNRRIEVVQEFTADVPTIQADRQQLRQLFLNLLTNASDAMPRGGTLALRVGPKTTGDEGDAVVAEFADTGEGIAPEDLNKIWDPFFTTKAEGRGTGLGLAICKRVVEEHGGTIDIESRISKGTIVRIAFPATSNGTAARFL